MPLLDGKSIQGSISFAIKIDMGLMVKIQDRLRRPARSGFHAICFFIKPRMVLSKSM